MQVAVYALICFSCFAFSAVAVFKSVTRLKRVNETKNWPSVEGTVRSGNLEAVHHLRFGELQLAVFDFSYAVDQKPYTERFALSMHKEPADSLISKMVGRRIPVQYNPQDPASCYIPGGTMEGCRIEQKIGSLIRFNPKNQGV
jgi:Protein of unknown function (DUF3592)